MMNLSRSVKIPVFAVLLLGILGSTAPCQITTSLDNCIKKFNKFNPSFIMGVIFSLAFCPTLFWLFFGLVIPLSLKTAHGFALPVFFAIGNLVPLTLIILSVSMGESFVSFKIKQIKKMQKVFKMLGGIILVLIGILNSFVYWFT